MADLSINCAGIKSPNPFWLASAPPTNSGGQIQRAFDLGWGGAVWKTLGEPIINVNSRFWSIDYGSTRMMGLNNIELITARPWDTNIREIKETKKKYPKNAVVVSMMIESKQESWHEAVKEVNDTGCDGIELNFGCPHGMSERGMGSAVGQVPEYTKMITEWVKKVAEVPVLVKLTPNISNVAVIGRAAAAGKADGISLINTINSIMGINLDNFSPYPSVDGKGSHGGYCGPAVKPIALNMVSAIAKDAEIGIPVSGIGGIATWQDAVEFMVLGATSVQVCTAVMHYGYRIIEDLCDGLSNWMDEKGFKTIAEVSGHSLHRVSEFKDFDLSYRAVARIDAEKCIKCNLCYVACNDTAHQCIDLISPQGAVVEPLSYNVRANGKDEATETRPQPQVREVDCVGCRLCYNVCPVDDCIAMVEVPSGRSAVTWSELSQNLSRVTEDWETMKAYRERVGIHIH
jgi:dihydropyrimidine dehydrogenase (NAD+) subunit PreA